MLSRSSPRVPRNQRRVRTPDRFRGSQPVALQISDLSWPRALGWKPIPTKLVSFAVPLMMAVAQPLSFLELPFDVRRIVLGHVFFDESLEKCIVDTGKRERLMYRVKPYNIQPSRPNGCAFATRPMCLFQVCKQLQQEGARALYPSLLFDLVYGFDEERALRFLDAVAAYHHLIRCVRLGMYFVDYILPVCAWTDTMHTMSTRCTGMEKLTLVYPTPKVRTDTDTLPLAPTAQELSLIEQVAHFATRTNIEVEQSVSALELNEQGVRLRYSANPPAPPARGTERDVEMPSASFSSFKHLPQEIQRQVIEATILPANGIVHPTLHASASLETASILPLLLTSKGLHAMTEDILYGKALFSSCCRKDRAAMIAFMRSRTPKQLSLVRRYFISGQDHWMDR